MSFLTPEESVTLQNIIIRHPQIIGERTRVAVLKNCSIYELLTNLDTSGGPGIFVVDLLAQLQDPHLETSHGQPPLIALLVYLRLTYENKLLAQELAFLDDVAARCEQWYIASNPGKQLMRAAFAVQRQQLTPALNSTNPSEKTDFRRKLVIDYDLELVMKDFKQPLMPGRAFGFVIASGAYILRSYVIERMLQEFKQEVPGESFPLSIDLNQHDLASFPLHSLLEEKVKLHFGYTNACQLVTRRSQEHVIMIVWNNDLPLTMLQEALTSFWQRFVPGIARHLRTKKLYFILILAHLPSEIQPGQIENFTTLQLPPFDVQDSLRPWLLRSLPQLNVPDAQLKICLNKLQDLHTDQFQIFRRMEDIASFLQGEYDKDRFHPPKAHPTKRKSPRR